jgi:hypothetical protein
MSMSSDIPQARDVIRNVIECCKITRAGRERLEFALRLMVRAPFKRKAAPRSPPITAKLRDEVLQTAANNPEWHLSDIAEVHGINMARVSEIINGKYRNLKR